MALVSTAEMNAATEAWLGSQEAYRQYISKTQALFTCWLTTWDGPRQYAVHGFTAYCEALLTAEGYSHSEIKALCMNPKEKVK